MFYWRKTISTSGSILKQYLEIHHFDVTWALDGKEALEIFKTSEEGVIIPFSICVFDVNDA